MGTKAKTGKGSGRHDGELERNQSPDAKDTGGNTSTDTPASSDDQHATTESHDLPTEKLTTDAGTGGDILVEVMKAAGVRVAFGIISIHNIPLVEAVDRDLRFVPMRHEAAAINAADAYARATGGIGVAITSTGTGAGNAAGSMLEALTAQSRVLHVTGNIDSSLLGEHSGAYHEVPRQLEMLGAVSGHALRIDTARQPRAVLTEAVRLLLTAPHLPVSVDWPIDLQYTADPNKQNLVRDKEIRLRSAPKRDLERAVRAMREAHRPLIWAGGGAREVGPALTALAQAWGAGILTGANGRGSVPEDHPLVIGNFGADESLTDLLDAADCLLTVGSHLRAHETRSGEAPLPENHIQVDLEADALGRNHPVSVGIQADARTVVPDLLAALGDTGMTAPAAPDTTTDRSAETAENRESGEDQPGTDPDWSAQVARAAKRARKAHRKDIGAYAQICDSIRSRLPRRSPIVRDVTIPGSSWGNRLLAVYDPTDNVFAAGGGIGQGLAMSIGAAIGAAARPTNATGAPSPKVYDSTEPPVLAIIGDGGLAVHLGELGVLAAEQPHVVIVVFNDGGYGVLRNMQQAKQAEPRAVDLATPDLGALCAAYRLPHRLVASPKRFDKALKKALRRGGPSVIEVDVPALRPQPEPFVPPVQVP